MCDRLSLIYDLEAIYEKLPFLNKEINIGLIKQEELYSNSELSIIYSFSIRRAKWGFSTNILKEQLLVIRSEGIASKGYFRNYFYKQRILFPVNAFFVLKESVIDGRKITFKIEMKDNSVFFIAGILNPENNSCAILNTTASILLKQIYNRMPVIIPYDKCKIWLDNSFCNTEVLLPFLTAYDSSKMTIHQVS